MKTRRVGTISMAIVLIGFGLLLLIAQFSQLSAVKLATKFWPLTLILLGGEILWFVHKNKGSKDNCPIRYDIFSMFIVFIILMVNIGLYSLLETGVLDHIKLRMTEENIRYQEYINEMKE